MKVDYSFLNFQTYFPQLCRRTVDWYHDEERYGWLHIMLDDGSEIIYDEFMNSIIDPNDILDDEAEFNEEEWKRLFSERLRMQMRHRGIVQKDLANKIGVSEVTISHYMNGVNVPRTDVTVKIANALHCSVDFLSNPYKKL